MAAKLRGECPVKKLYRLLILYLVCELGMLLIFPFIHNQIMHNFYLSFIVIFVLLLICFILVFRIIQTARAAIDQSAKEYSEITCRKLLQGRNGSLKKEQEELIRLAEQMRKNNKPVLLPEESMVRYCPHPLADAILRHKVINMKERGISTDVSAALPADLKISDKNLLAILMNMIDNAADAAEKTDSPSVSIRLWIKSGYMVCQVKNTAVDKPTPGVSSKKETGHGFGLKIIEDTCRKEGGSYHIETSDGWCTTTASLQLESGTSE